MGPLTFVSPHANNGVSQYPRHQKNFMLAENLQIIFRTLSKLDEFSLISLLCFAKKF